MLFFVILLLFALLFFVGFITESDDLIASGLVFGLLSAFLLSTLIILNTCSKENDKLMAEEEYRALTYKVEHCQDEFGLLSADIVNDVCEWNKKVIKHKKYEKNFWVGIFYPNGIYDNCQTIEYEMIK